MRTVLVMDISMTYDNVSDVGNWKPKIVFVSRTKSVILLGTSFNTNFFYKWNICGSFS